MRLRTWLILMLMFTIVGCDQFSKAVVRETVSAPKPFFGGLFIIEHAENSGAFLSLGAGMGEFLRLWVFTIAVGIFLMICLAVLLKDQTKDWRRWAGLTLLLAGGLGNLIDRVTKGTVTDFLFFGFGRLHTGIFNFADVAIVIGAVLLIQSRRAISN